MHRLNRILGLAVAAIGLGLAGWAPLAFEALSGHSLPTPIATDATAMTIWSAVAFVRAFGAVLFGLGAVLWAASARAGTRSVERAVFISSALTAVIVLTQQVAIWENAVGYVLVGLFCVVALVTGIGLLKTTESSIRNTA